MEKLDRLGWAAQMAFTCYGVSIGLRANDPAMLSQAEDFLPPTWRQVSVAESTRMDKIYSIWKGGNGKRSSVRGYDLLYGDHVRLVRTMDSDRVFSSLENEMKLTVATHAPRRLFVHAGVVGWRGKAVLIPGRSHSGKSTLTAELVRAGATYYSDEYAVLDTRGLVYPYARHLVIREGKRATGLPAGRYDVREIGGKTGRAALPVGLVVVSRYRDQARWQPKELSSGEGLLELLENTVAARYKPRRTLQVLKKVVVKAPILKSPRGESGEVAHSILKALAERDSNSSACEPPSHSARQERRRIQ